MKLSPLRQWIVATLVSAVLGAVPVATRATDLLDQVRERGTLRIGLEGTYPPFNSRNSHRELVGYDVDVAKAIAMRLGVKPEFVTSEWSGILAGLQAGKFDVVVNQVGITSIRRKVLDFSQPYMYSIAQLIQRKNDSRQFKLLANLKGKRIGVSLGSNYSAMAKTLPGVDVKTYPGASECLRDLVSGRIDAVLNDRLMLVYLLHNTTLSLRPSNTLGKQEKIGIPFKKGNPKFSKVIDDIIAQLKSDGTLPHISNKWFRVDVTQPQR